MKKTLIIAVLMLSLASMSIFALGIGIQGGSDVYNYGYYGYGYYGRYSSLDITFKIDSIPLMFAVGIPSFNPFALGISADYWILNPTLTGGNGWNLSWYLGVGGFVNFFIPQNDFFFGFGARVPIGLSFRFLKEILELYLQIAPGIELDVYNGVHPGFILPINYGFRVWI